MCVIVPNPILFFENIHQLLKMKNIYIFYVKKKKNYEKKRQFPPKKYYLFLLATVSLS